MKLYMAISQLGYYGSSINYSELSEKYEQNMGVFLKKQSYELDNCFSLEYLSYEDYENKYDTIVPKPGAFRNTKYSADSWHESCSSRRTPTLRYHKIKSVAETEDGYKAKVGYIEAVLKTDESTSEVWYEMTIGDKVKKFSCGYDKSNCKIDKLLMNL